MRVSSIAGKSERIKTHQCSFYTEFKETCNAIVGFHRQSLDPKTRSLEPSYRLLGHLPSLPWDQPRFRAPPDSPLGGRTPLHSIMWCPCRPIGPHSPWSTPLFKWIHFPESKMSTPSEEALVRGTSHVQCNPLTLPNT
ncbi:hypothetical protein M9H77_12309 [Catharanthus roseus]|uniref:Uncharacterized protein n=1 Tax=Catharanthus roseus TaxID=4058 RepID=A0ACC0BH05_CATRO|nr:hypothetical protein M9H77_12309 [Catharanthus roseus]